jgi:hypothetical protein
LEAAAALVVRARAEQVGDPRGLRGRCAARGPLGGQFLRSFEVQCRDRQLLLLSEMLRPHHRERSRYQAAQGDENDHRADQPQRGEHRVADRRTRRRPVQLGYRDHRETEPEPQPRSAAAPVPVDDVADGHHGPRRQHRHHEHGRQDPGGDGGLGDQRAAVAHGTDHREHPRHRR